MSTKKKLDQSHIFEGKIREYEDKLIEFFLEIGKHRGQTPTLTRILGYLMIHGRLTQKQLKQLTGLSVGSISTNFAVMMSLGVIEKKIIPGTHAYEYSLKIDLTQNIATTMKISLQYMTQAVDFIRTKRSELEESFDHNKKEFKIFSNILQELNNALMMYLKIFKVIINPKANDDLTVEIEKLDELNYLETFDLEFEEFEVQIIDFFLSLPILLGKQDIFSKTFGYFITRKKLNQNILRNLTGLSAGKVSEEINKLLDEGIIEISTKTKSGQIIYQMKSIITSLLQITFNILIVYQKWKKRLEEIRSELINEKNRLKNLNGYEEISKTTDVYLNLMPVFENIYELVEEIRRKLGKH